MSKEPTTIKVPGKLMIAGEFAVLEPYQKLAVMAVNRFVYTTIQEDSRNQLSLKNFKLMSLLWKFQQNEVKVFTDDKRVSFVQNAMSVALTYLEEKNISFSPFHLTVQSELDDGLGKKYGLGSSAAVVTSVISAILHHFLEEKPSGDLIFKLSAITHAKTQGNGSGADVAASTYGGILLYSSFQAEWLKKQYNNRKSVHSLLEKDWKYLSVRPIQLPDNIFICIGWTGSPASTVKLVDEILKLKENNSQSFNTFLQTSQDAVENFMDGMESANIQQLLNGIRKNRIALRTVGQAANVDIETALLGKLCDLAEQYGGAGKPSGAGGGDCGIAFMPSEEAAHQLMRAWEEAGITPLSIQPYFKEAHVSD